MCAASDHQLALPRSCASRLNAVPTMSLCFRGVADYADIKCVCFILITGMGCGPCRPAKVGMHSSQVLEMTALAPPAHSFSSTHTTTTHICHVCKLSVFTDSL